MSGSSLAISIDKIRGPRQAAEQDRVAVEEPLEIQLCSADARGAAAKSLSVTMRTPGDDIDLTLGFLLGESIIRTIDDVAEIGAVGAADDYLKITQGKNAGLRARTKLLWQITIAGVAANFILMICWFMSVMAKLSK